jgi:hypothetical protein
MACFLLILVIVIMVILLAVSVTGQSAYATVADSSDPLVMPLLSP